MEVSARVQPTPGSSFSPTAWETADSPTKPPCASTPRHWPIASSAPSPSASEDYEAVQLTALSDGGAGEFHHATNPNEILEIIFAELKALRVTAARDLRLTVTAHAGRWRLRRR
jgi:hypothetical protein